MWVDVLQFFKKSLNSKHWFIYYSIHRTTPFQYKWVKRHTNKHPWKSIDDLMHQKLASEEIYYVWCDHLAWITWEQGPPSFFDPEVSPQKKWAVYSDHPVPHKIIGHLGTELQFHLSFSSIRLYIQTKHNLSDPIIDKINIVALEKYLRLLSVHLRANTIKLIHHWTPTFAFLSCQGRESLPICNRCQKAVETSAHILTCGDLQAIDQRFSLLQSSLQELLKISTPIQIVTVSEYKISLVLNIPYKKNFQLASALSQPHHSILITAIRHQNLIGWDCFLKGYTSTLWSTLVTETSLSTIRSQPNADSLDVLFIAAIIKLHKSIWEDRNKILHGTTGRGSS